MKVMYGTQAMLGIDGVSSQFFDDIGAVSGETTVFSSSATLKKNKVHFDQRQKPIVGKKRGKKGRRKLATTGTHTVLVVRVIASDGPTTSNETVLSDKVFGTYGDMLNLKSGYNACSYGQLQMVPVTNSKVTNGVISLTVATKAKGIDTSILESAVMNAISNTLGSSSQFDHVIICLPPGALFSNVGGWVAYGYVNYGRTVFNDVSCLYPSVLMHEIGHNMNFGHSGIGNNEYGDETCLMGYSYMWDSSTESPHMCFNGAKSFNTGWYASRVQTINILSGSTFSPTTLTLIGISDYNVNIAGSAFVVVKLETGTVDYYIAFNRNSGINNETQGPLNSVIVTSQGDNPSDSVIVGNLPSAGRSITLRQVQSSRYDVTISVSSIDVKKSPGTAVITVSRTVSILTTSPTKRAITRPPTQLFTIKQGYTCGTIDKKRSASFTSPQWYTGCMNICTKDTKCLGFFFQKNLQQNILTCVNLYYSPKSNMVNTGSLEASIFCGFKNGIVFNPTPTAILTSRPTKKGVKVPVGKPSSVRVSQAPTQPFIIRQGWTCGNIDNSNSVTYNTLQWYTGCLNTCVKDARCLGFFFQKNLQQNIQTCQILYYNPRSFMVNTGNTSANIFCAYKAS